MKTLYEGILSDMEDTLTQGDIQIERDKLRKEIEDKTDGKWTLSKNGKYLMYNEKPWLMGAPRFGWHSSINPIKFISPYIKEWSTKHNLKLQPIGALETTIDKLDKDIIENINPIWLSEFVIVTKGLNADISNLCLNSDNLGVLKIDNSYHNPVSSGDVIPPKNYLSTVVIDLAINKIKNWNCDTLIVENNYTNNSSTAKKLIFYEFYTLDYDALRYNEDAIQQLIDNNPNVKTFFIRTHYDNKYQYHPIKLKNKKFNKIGKYVGGRAMESKALSGLFKYRSPNGKDYINWYNENKPY